VGKVVGGVLAAVVVLVIAATAGAASLFGNLTPAAPGGGSVVAPSRKALADIPPRKLALYQQATGECPGLPWTVLAAIGKVETDHGRHPTMISPDGAVGPIQFLPATFESYDEPVPTGGSQPPTPWDPVNAVHAAARLLCAHGARHGKDIEGALWQYNHSHSYVQRVLTIADSYAATTAPSTKAAATAVAFAGDQLGTPYVWGGDGPAEGGFDCSGLTKAAYATAGITIPRVAQAQFDRGPRLPRGADLLPGDLLFYGTDPEHITHVALYIGHGRAIDAPRPGTVVREGPATTGPTFQGATRPAQPEPAR
jgi:cell wall-associated NlpC family hydrolase